MTNKTDEQERAKFEAWHVGKYWVPVFDDELGRFIPTVVQNRWEAYQAGRAALQSQDREDADLKEALLLALEYWADRQQRYKNRSPVWVQKARAALGIDHARRIEGDGE